MIDEDLRFDYGTVNSFTLAEDWLVEAGRMLDADLFRPRGYVAPVDNVRYRIGMPPGTKGTSLRVLGLYCPDVMTGDKVPQVYIAPQMADAVTVLATLAHELIHAIYPLDGHPAKTFGKCARAIGLDGMLTATYAGDTLRPRLVDMARKLGPYPHGSITGTGRKKQGIRQRLATCANGLCDAKMRLSAKQFEEREWYHRCDDGDIVALELTED